MASGPRLHLRDGRWRVVLRWAKDALNEPYAAEAEDVHGEVEQIIEDALRDTGAARQRLQAERCFVCEKRLDGDDAIALQDEQWMHLACAVRASESSDG